MVPEMEGVARLYGVGARVLDGLVGDFAPADWQVRDSLGHSATWLVGHVATYRRRMLALMGVERPEAPWEKCFGQGTSPADVPADLDPLTLLQTFREVSEAIAGRWEALTPEDLAKPFSRTLPDGSNTLGGALNFMVWHETYHLGQLGFMRRLAGRPGRA
jgi:uncharacterized damage-inducible protein DinB